MSSTTMTLEELTQKAGELGTQAYAKNIKAPVHDPEFYDLMSSHPPKHISAMLNAWTASWHAAHAAATNTVLPPSNRDQLFPDSLERSLLAAGERIARGEPVQEIQAKLFTPDSSATWLLVGMEPAEPDGQVLWVVADLGFGVVEYGTVYRHELEHSLGPSGLPIERDIHFDPSGLVVDNVISLNSLSDSGIESARIATHEPRGQRI